MADFFGTLKHRLAPKPTREFDAQFWDRFENEFGRKKERAPAKWAAGMAAALLVAWMGARGSMQGSSGLAARDLPVPSVPREEMLAHMDVLKAFDRLPVTDKEWSVLLAREDGAEAAGR
jgi:hypothetical protein